jgi:hypothetical protein
MPNMRLMPTSTTGDFTTAIEAMRTVGWRAPAFGAFLDAGAETVGDTPTHNG